MVTFRFCTILSKRNTCHSPFNSCFAHASDQLTCWACLTKVSKTRASSFARGPRIDAFTCTLPLSSKLCWDTAAAFLIWACFAIAARLQAISLSSSIDLDPLCHHLSCPLISSVSHESFVFYVVTSPSLFLSLSLSSLSPSPSPYSFWLSWTPLAYIIVQSSYGLRSRSHHLSPAPPPVQFPFFYWTERACICLNRMGWDGNITVFVPPTVCVILCLTLLFFLSFAHQAAGESTEITRPRGIRQLVMVVTRKCNDPTYKPPSHFCPSKHARSWYQWPSVKGVAIRLIAWFFALLPAAQLEMVLSTWIENWK